MPLRLVTLAALLGMRARHLLVACGALTGLVLALGVILLLVAARRETIADAERELENLSLVLAEDTDRTFQATELVELGLIEHLRQLGIDTPGEFDAVVATRDMQQELLRRLAGLPAINGLRLINHVGRVIGVSAPGAPPNIDVSDRDYVRTLMQDPGRTFVVSLPLQSRLDGSRSIVFAHSYTSRDGELIGIVGAGLLLDGFERLFARISVGGDPAFSLFRADGVMLARYPRMDGDLGRTNGPAEDFTALKLASDDHQVVRRVGKFDGKSRLIAPYQVAHFPLLLLATNTEEAILAPWRVQLHRAIGVTVLAELVLGLVVLFGVRHLGAQEELAAADATAIRAEAARSLAEAELTLAHEREISERAKQLQAQRFDTALNNMVQGLMMVDGAGRLVIVNKRFIELCGLPSDTLRLVDTYADLLEIMVACGNFSARDMAILRAWRQNMTAHHVRSNFVWELNDGRAFEITHQPMPDGWLATYEDVTESRRTDVRMAYMARHDALTDLPNRTLFHEKLEAALAHARHGEDLALLCLDLDQFKAVNDTLGHPVGDGLLQAVASRLLGRTRDTDIVARLGGDEFAVVQTPIDKPEDAAAFAERLIAMLEEPFEVAGHQIIIGTSVGIALAPQDGLDTDQLLKSADLALYRAKLEGRGVYRMFQAEMDAQMQARRLLELDLRNALPGGQFELFYQPLIDLRTRTVGGFEALLRWRHPVKGLVPPDAFIPLAEEIGAIVAIGAWVLHRACVTAAGWPDGMKVAVNLSPVQFRSPDLVAFVAAALRESGLPANRLELEITETTLLRDTAATLATLHEMHELGVCIAMDDFGTGYSSLSYLRQFPFDRIKIDQSFIREIGKTRDCGAIVRAVTTLGRELGIATTAEGVETREQLVELARSGCTDVQGYLFSRPVPEMAIPELLRSMPSIHEMLPLGSVCADDAVPGAHARVGGDKATDQRMRARDAERMGMAQAMGAR